MPTEDLVIWLEALDKGTVTVDGANNLVSLWADQSGYGNDFSATGAERPIYNQDDALDFSSVGPFLRGNNTGAASQRNTIAAFTVASIFETNNRIPVQVVYSAGWGGNATYVPIIYISSNQIRVSIPQSDGSSLAAFTPIYNNTPTKVVVIWDGTTLTLRVSGRVEYTITGVSSTFSGFTIDTIGCRNDTFSSPLRGLVSALFFYTSALTAPEVGALESYLKFRYSA